MGALQVIVPSFGWAQVGFEEASDFVGINYRHPQPDRAEARRNLLQKTQVTPLTMPELFNGSLFHATGKSSINLLDYDGDGDVDIFATNIEGQANSLYQNRWAEDAELFFVDVAAQAGVADPAHNASGACHGDIDNDGDQDIFVVGDDEDHRLYLNQGEGRYTEITGRSGATFKGEPFRGGAGCALGDIDNDGLLDIFVGHTWDWRTAVPCAVVPYAQNQPNELFRNLGHGRFENVSESSGILELTGGDLIPGAQGLTWSQAFVDYDQDGDVDLFNVDDQCAFAPRALGGVDRGLIQVWDNDGQGNFKNVTETAGTAVMGQWMGIDFADFNHDGLLDFVASSMGDYMLSTIGQPVALGRNSTRWFFGTTDGSFVEPPRHQGEATAFGWGAVAEDFNNDGHTDIFYAGGIDLAFVVTADNPDILLMNDGQGRFRNVPSSTEERGIHDNVQSVVAGDLDQDGRIDLVLGSNLTIPEGTSFKKSIAAPFGSPLDDTAFFVENLSPLPDGTFVWNGFEYNPGRMRVELNQTKTDYESVSVRVVGTVGLTLRSKVNRDGVGAIVSFTPRGGVKAMKPVMAGSSHVSQGDGSLRFGLGHARWGELEVQWPGGVKNRAYGIRPGRPFLMPEIPCSIDGPGPLSVYRTCVRRALSDLQKAGLVSKNESNALAIDAIRAFVDEHQ